ERERDGDPELAQEADERAVPREELSLLAELALLELGQQLAGDGPPVVEEEVAQGEVGAAEDVVERADDLGGRPAPEGVEEPVHLAWIEAAAIGPGGADRAAQIVTADVQHGV